MIILYVLLLDYLWYIIGIKIKNMKKVIYRLWVFNKNREILLSQEVYREDWNRLLGHLNRNVKDWHEFTFRKIVKES